MENGSMILVATIGADGGEGQLGIFLGEIHAQLTREDDLTLSRFGVDGLHGDIVIVADDLLDILDGDLLGAGLDILVHHLLGEVHGDFPVVKGGLRKDGDDGAFQLDRKSVV